MVNNDYTIRFQNRLYQLDKPIYPGERGGKVIIELRLDGTMAIRFGQHYLNYHEIPLSNAAASGAEQGAAKKDETSSSVASSSGVKPTNGRSGRTPAEPYPPAGTAKVMSQGPHRPAADHPWRRGLPRSPRRK